MRKAGDFAKSGFGFVDWSSTAKTTRKDIKQALRVGRVGIFIVEGDHSEDTNWKFTPRT